MKFGLESIAIFFSYFRFLNFRRDYYFFYDYMDVSARASQKAHLTPQMKLLNDTTEVCIYFEYGMDMVYGDLCE